MWIRYGVFTTVLILVWNTSVFKAAVFLYPNKKEVAMKEGILLAAETWTTSDTVHFLAILLMPIILGLLILIFGLIDKAIRGKKKI